METFEIFVLSPQPLPTLVLCDVSPAPLAMLCM